MTETEMQALALSTTPTPIRDNDSPRLLLLRACEAFIKQVEWRGEREKDDCGSNCLVCLRAQVNGHKEDCELVALRNRLHVAIANEEKASVLGTCDCIHCPYADHPRNNQSKPHRNSSLCFGRWTPVGGWKVLGVT